MRLRHLLTPIALASAGASATTHAAVSGHCHYGDHALVFIDAVAARAPDPFDDTGKVTTLWLTTAAMDHAALARVPADKLDDAVTEQVFGNDGAELTLRLGADDRHVEGLQLYVPPGSNRSLSSNEVGQLHLRAAPSTSVAGDFSLNDDDELDCDLHFDVPMAGIGPPPPPPKPWGTALPAGGGEPGKAYLELHRAALAGDVDTMLRLATKERGEAMREARNQPDFPQMLAMIKAFEPAEVRIVSGRGEGDRAELQIAGKDGDGAAITGQVKLVREAGQWHIENVSTQSGGDR